VALTFGVRGSVMSYTTQVVPISATANKPIRVL